MIHLALPTATRVPQHHESRKLLLRLHLNARQQAAAAT